MSRTPRAFRPSLDGLEARVALSTAPAALVADPARSGSVAGDYFAPGGDNRAADAPLEVDLSGSGSLRGMGRVRMAGSLRMGGFLPAGVPDIHGTVTIRNGLGSITVRLAGSGGNGPVPGERFRLEAAVVGGTGLYRNARRLGVADISFGPSTVQSIAAPTPLGGAMTFVLRLKPR